MHYLTERNLVWNLLELIIVKHNLNISSEFLNPNSEDNIEFGDFISGHPMCFSQDYNECICELERKLPNEYKITTANIIGTGEGSIGITKLNMR